METFEDRAWKAFPKCDYEAELYRKKKRIGYVQGAVEQKAIDDVKYKKLRSLAKDMYTKAQYLSTDASQLRKACEAFYNYINYEEKER